MLGNLQSRIPRKGDNARDPNLIPTDERTDQDKIADFSMGVIRQPKWIDIYDTLFGDDNEMEMEDTAHGPKAAAGKVVQAGEKMDAKPMALDESKLRTLILKNSPHDGEIEIGKIRTYYKQYFGYDLILKGKMIDFLEMAQFTSMTIVKRNKQQFIRLNDHTLPGLPVPKVATSPPKLFLMRNKKLVQRRKMKRPLVRHKLGSRIIPFEPTDHPYNTPSKSIKMEMLETRTRRSNKISTTHGSNSPLNPTATSNTLTWTAKKRIKTILQDRTSIYYSDFRKAYRCKYGDLPTDSETVREYMKTIPSWTVMKNKSGHYYLKKDVSAGSEKDVLTRSSLNSQQNETRYPLRNKSSDAPIHDLIEDAPSRTNTDTKSIVRSSSCPSERIAARDEVASTAITVNHSYNTSTALEKQVEISGKMLEAQLKKNEIDEDRNAIALFNLVGQMTAEKQEFIELMQQKYLQRLRSEVRSNGTTKRLRLDSYSKF